MFLLQCANSRRIDMILINGDGFFVVAKPTSFSDNILFLIVALFTPGAETFGKIIMAI
jgi:hypothetical protein